MTWFLGDLCLNYPRWESRYFPINSSSQILSLCHREVNNGVPIITTKELSVQPRPEIAFARHFSYHLESVATVAYYIVTEVVYNYNFLETIQRH